MISNRAADLLPDCLAGDKGRAEKKLLDVESDNALEVMGWPDDLKLKSSMTLFAVVKPECEVFQKVLDKFFHGERDQRTIEIL